MDGVCLPVTGAQALTIVTRPGMKSAANSRTLNMLAYGWLDTFPVGQTGWSCA